ncbi:MAG: DUF2723 domain-containing protein [Verrucomicrobiota bacterium]
MKPDTQPGTHPPVILRWLPWLIGAAFLLLYALTLPRDITLQNAWLMARVLGWESSATYQSPLFFLLYLPVRWLPDAWQIGGAGCLSAGCAALTLVLLLRSLSLLPHDRTPAQRLRLPAESGTRLPAGMFWLSGVLAALLLGWQLSFWEQATHPTGEALNVLLFAACVWCLLEYRGSRSFGWLVGFSLLYGMAMANNSAMIAFWPVFFVATLWITAPDLVNWPRIWRHLRGERRAKKSSNIVPDKAMGQPSEPAQPPEPSDHRRYYVDLPLALAMLSAGAVGALCYLILPVYHLANGLTDYGFWRELRIVLSTQKAEVLEAHRPLALLLGAAVVVPLFFIAIRWEIDFKKRQWQQRVLIKTLFHLAHALCLGMAVYYALDHRFSPRVLSRGPVYLPLYYLNALVAGYCAGYMLLIFGRQPAKADAEVEDSALVPLLGRAGKILVWIICLAGPVLLTYNLPRLLENQTTLLARYGGVAAGCLPEKGALVLSDDYALLAAVRVALGGQAAQHCLVYTPHLMQPLYYRLMERRHAVFWPLPGTNALVAQLDAKIVAQQLITLSKTVPIYSLHPIYGNLGEAFHSVPDRLLYRLQPRAANLAERKLLSRAQMEVNQTFWNAFGTEAAAMKLVLSPARKRGQREALVLSQLYSQARNYAGVLVQRQGELTNAGANFAAALVINSNNLAAAINHDFNQAWQTTGHPPQRGNTNWVRRLAPYVARWEAGLAVLGPVDEPLVCASLGIQFQSRQWHRQALDELRRAVFFMPHEYGFRLALAAAYNAAGQPDEGLKELRLVRTDPWFQTNLQRDPFPLVEVESWAYYTKKEYAKANALLENFSRTHTDDKRPLNIQMQFLLKLGQTAEAEALLESQVSKVSTNVALLANTAGIMLMNSNAAKALVYLERANFLAPNNPVVLNNRGLAYLELDRLEEAREDFEALKRKVGASPLVYYGLGESHYRSKNLMEARRNFEAFLRVAQPGNPDWQKVAERLTELKALQGH